MFSMRYTCSNFSLLEILFKHFVFFRELDVAQGSLDFALGVLSLATNVKYDESIAESNSKFETAVSSCLLLLDTIASSRYFNFF